MKIVCTGMNYMPHNNGHADTLLPSGNPVIFMKPDSSILRNRKPFFLPDYMGRVELGSQLVVRINRLGKSIAGRFASRYWDAVTLGVDFTAIDVRAALAAQGQPWELSKCFDGSAVIGDWIEKEDIDDIQALDLRLDLDEKPLQSDNTRNMVCSVDRLIEYISGYCTLKTGDLIFTGTMAGAAPVSIGQHVQGYIDGRNVLDFHVR